MSCLLLTGCDGIPENSTVSGLPPTLSGFSFSPNFVDLAVADKNSDGDALVSLSVTVTASDPETDIQEVVLTVASPIANQDPVVTESLLVTTGSEYSINYDMVLPAAELGIYTVRVTAYDSNANLSNQVRGNLLFTSTSGSPPVVTAFEAFPEVVTPPATLKMVATVTDPDGIANILSVLITTPNNQELEMFDDGITSGDDVASDGMYTASFDVPVGVTPGVQTFSVKAVDRSGLESDTVEKDVTIQ